VLLLLQVVIFLMRERAEDPMSSFASRQLLQHNFFNHSSRTRDMWHQSAVAMAIVSAALTVELFTLFGARSENSARSTSERAHAAARSRGAAGALGLSRRWQPGGSHFLLDAGLLLICLASQCQTRLCLGGAPLCLIGSQSA